MIDSQQLLLTHCENLMAAISAINENESLNTKANKSLRKIKDEVADFIDGVLKLREKVKPDQKNKDRRRRKNRATPCCKCHCHIQEERPK